LLDAVKRRRRAGACRFTLLTPDVQNRKVADWTLESALPLLGAAGEPVEGLVGGADPFTSIQQAVQEQNHDPTRSIPLASLELLWERRDIDLRRERTLWRLLYETAARADEVLRLDIEDLDIPARRARTRSKGGDVDRLFFGSGSARLLPRPIAGRRAGPVFLSSLRPSLPARSSNIDSASRPGRT
jgi:hypothetical protein